MQLRYNNTFSTVDYKGAISCHIRYRAKENILNFRFKIFMVGVSTVEFEFSLQRYAISESTLQTLINGVAWRVDIVIQELKNEIITCVGDGEVLGEHLIQAVILAFLRRSIQLQEISERLQLHIEEIRKWHRIFNAAKVYSIIY